MKRNTFNKRAVSCVIALALVLSCFVTAFAGTFIEYKGDGGDNRTKVKVTTNGKITYTTVNATPLNTYNGVNQSPPVGTLCTFEAAETVDDELVFMYWVDLLSGRIYSYDRKIQFVASSRVSLRAEYADISQTKHRVTYVNYGGTILKDDNGGQGASYTIGTDVVMPPTDTDLPGFTFKGWSKYPRDIADDPSNQVIYPKYTVNQETYTVTLTDDSYASGAGEYMNFQTVNLKAKEKNGSGQSFSYWQDENGTIVSYERNYSFRINYNITLTPVFGENVTPEPVIRISKVYRNLSKSKITFYAERSVPDTYTVVSHGILLAYGSGVDENPLTVSNGADAASTSAKVRKAYGDSNEPFGTFSLAKSGLDPAEAVKARPFVIVKDAEGVQSVVYGDEVNTTNGVAG